MTTFTQFKLAAAALAMFTVAEAPAPLKKLNVVATTPDLAALGKAIGGDAVEVKALAKPTEDPHFVDAKPSHIITLNRADVLIEGGAELEIGWLPPLLESARNDKLAAGAPGRISASNGLHMMEIPTTFDRSKGDVHALGNPHFIIDPVNVRPVVAHIADHFARVDPVNAALYKGNLAKFLATLDAKSAEWTKAMEPVKGAKIVTYHNDFIYFAERYKLDVVETLEPKPGIAPSPAHLARVIAKMQATKARVILVQPYQNRKTAETVARQTGGIVLDYSQQPGAMKGTVTWFDMMDLVVRSLVTAIQEKK